MAQSANDSDSGAKYKVTAVIALFAFAGAWGWHGYKGATPSAAINNGSNGMGFGPPRGGGNAASRPGGRGPGGPGGPMADLGLTKEQQAAMQTARDEAKGDFGKMRETMDKILTADQRQKMREGFEKRRAEMDAKMKKSMSDADWQSFEHKRETGGFMRPPGFRGGPGGGGPGSGGPPPGPPPGDGPPAGGMTNHNGQEA